ncbi:g10933 [Coccomyxa viridis]|uniref:G10933 protein n=1 Tax=Coccomyxa viridis TaxID=1274662 RepID=A0ABP1G6Z7_9CHLO
MPLGRLVPWSSWDEWERVRGGLFSADTAQLRRALKQVSAWEARGKLPLGADMTAAIQRMRLRDPALTSPEQQACQRLSAEQESMLRMQYALAIIRLVNGISDSAQKGTVAKSVANLAETAGLPRILVDIRHEASHNELPSLALLRLGAATALAWLSQSYWQQQADHVTLRKSQIHDLLQAYVQSHQECLGRSQDAHGKPDEFGNAAPAQLDAGTSAAEGQKLRREILSQLLSKVQSNAASLVEPLLGIGMLDVSAACPEVAQDTTPEGAAAVALWQATLKDLSAVWPSLCQRLLARAVQDIAEAPTCWKSHAWIQLLLEGPPHKQSMKEGLGHKSKRRKKAAADCDQDPLLTSLWMPSKRLLLSSLSSCIQASASAGKPTSEGTIRPSALQRSVDLILGKLRSTALASNTSEHLKVLADLASTTAANLHGSDTMREDSDMTDAAPHPPADPSKAGPCLGEAIAQQQMLVQQHSLTKDPNGQRTSGWGVAESWAPCAIGMMPCDKSPTGRAPNTVLEPTTVAASELPQSRDPAMQPQHSRLAGSEAQAASAEYFPSERAAEDNAFDHTTAAQMHKSDLATGKSQAMEEDSCYFSRVDQLCAIGRPDLSAITTSMQVTAAA